MLPKTLGPFLGKTGHKAEALMVCCMDFRFQEAFDKFLEARNFAGCDVVGIAGGVKDWEQVEKHVEIAVNLHWVKTVILVNHRACGVYDKELQADPEKELQKHKQDLRETARKIKEKYSQLQVETWFAEMKVRDKTSEITFLPII